MIQKVIFGIDNFIANNKPQNYGNIGLLTNDAAFTAKGVCSRIALLRAGFSIKKLFSPEHGLSVKGADGAFIPNGTDVLTDLPIVSLYGDKLTPSHEDLADLDTVIFDIPDVGLRYYTYLWTLTYMLEQCAKNVTKLVVLDRPNPLSNIAEGPILDELHCGSFIGRWQIPVRHGCTLGELAMFFNAERAIGADLEVIRCENWQKNMFFTDWQLPFQPTSPAIVSWQTMLAYPITAYYEATNLSDGRGTTAPFAQIGATWMKALDVSMIKQIAEGMRFEPCEFIPSEGKFQGEICKGIKILVENPEKYKPVLLGLCLLKAIKEQFLKDFAWKPYPTRANPTGTRHLDLLIGITDAEKMFDLPWEVFLEKVSELTIVDEWQHLIKKYALY